MAIDARTLLGAFGALLYNSFLVSLTFIPAGPAFAIARAVGRLRYVRRSSQVELNVDLQAAVGATADQARRWIQRSFELATCEDYEYAMLARLTSTSLPGTMVVRGLEHVDRALQGRAGAILYSGHVRGFFTVFAALGGLGYRVNFVGKPPGWGHNPVEAWFIRRRFRLLERRFGCRFLPMADDNPGVLVQAANALQRNEIVWFGLDKTMSAHTADVSFLGRLDSFPAGPAILARSLNAPMIHFDVQWPNPSQPNVAEFGEAFRPSLGVHNIVQHCAGQIERGIVAHPEQWYHVCFPQWQLGGKVIETPPRPSQLNENTTDRGDSFNADRLQSQDAEGVA